MDTTGWQVRRAKGRRIYTGLSRAQVERALRTGKLTPQDLALPPGAARWMTVPVALVHTGEEAAAPAEAKEVGLPEWVPMQQEGRLVKPEQEEEDPAEMDMTPMIDVTTLLLIFFLVGGVFMLQAAIDLPKAKSGLPEMPAEKVPVGIFIRPAPNDPAGGTLAFEDAQAETVALNDVAKGYKSRVEDEAVRFLPEAIIKAHRDVPFGIVRQTMAKLTEAGVTQIKIGIEEPRGGGPATKPETP
jgi:biopolymer transport protein ExbD